MRALTMPIHALIDGRVIRLVRTMPSINAVFLVGYCEGEPRLIGDEGAVTFRIRLHEMVKGRGTRRFLRTEYFTVRALAAAASWVAGYVSDGSPIVVTGKLTTDRWTAGNGEKRKDTVIEANSVQPGLLTEEEELLAMGAEGRGAGSSRSTKGAATSQEGTTNSQAPATAAKAMRNVSTNTADDAAPRDDDDVSNDARAGTQTLPW
ncbi:MAG: hypothetical protein E6R08_00785 [Nevskiaceae bacterium]|nr:MAG: hypothetical protein E6R08_00785 [Nevskiaceae bacterium]